MANRRSGSYSGRPPQQPPSTLDPASSTNPKTLTGLSSTTKARSFSRSANHSAIA